MAPFCGALDLVVSASSHPMSCIDGGFLCNPFAKRTLIIPLLYKEFDAMPRNMI